jgi:hypothetical protein
MSGEIAWLDYAKRTVVFPGAGFYYEGPWRVVLHSTEGPTVAGALATYKRTGDYPHLTVGDTIEQSCSFLTAATALQNLSGGVETNRLPCIQIEIVGFAAEFPGMSVATRINLIQVMRDLQEAFNILPEAPAFKAYPSSYGANNGVRFSADQWRNFGGWCGHQHVPENLHGDPGNLDIQSLIAMITPVQPEPTPIDEDDDMQRDDDVVSEYRWPNGRSVVRLLRNGGVRCYGLKYRGNILVIPPEGRKNWTPGDGVVFPVDVNDPSKGYEVHDVDDNMIAAFTPEWAKANGIN